MPIFTAPQRRLRKYCLYLAGNNLNPAPLAYVGGPDVAPGATAFPWRRHSALVQWYVEPSGSPSAAVSWINTAHQAVQQYSVGGYVNYLEANQPPSRYFDPNLSRQGAVRQKCDPGRVMFSGLNF